MKWLEWCKARTRRRSRVQCVDPYHVMMAVFIVGAAAATSACKDSRFVTPLRAPLPTGTLGTMAATTCGATFRMISNTTDSLMAEYGIATVVDTVDVCETWTGSDYDHQALAVGSSDNIPGFTDTVQSVTYGSGAITGYAADGGAATAPASAGGTAFDFLYADSATRQASYDYPYYGIASPDPAACTQPPCPALSRNVPVRGAAAPGVDTVLRYRRHGVRRRGIRALIEGADEITRSPEGYRRFRRVRGNETEIWTIDPATELLVGEESAGPRDTTRGRHLWHRVAGGYVRARSDFETTEQIGGRRVRSSVAIAFENVKISDPAFQPLSGPVGTPVEVVP